jgi:hypothetical protein
MKAKVDNKREKYFYSNASGRNVDISGSILDDKMENLIDEDDENNFYSLGGDERHNPDKEKGRRRVNQHRTSLMLTMV